MSETNLNLFDEIFEVDAVEPKKFEKLPKGKYTVTMNKATEKERNGNTLITLEFQVSEGEYENRKIWLDFMMSTTNDKLEWITKRDKGHLHQLSKCLGFDQENRPASLDDFLDLPVVVDIGYRNDYVQLNFFSKPAAEGDKGEWTVF